MSCLMEVELRALLRSQKLSLPEFKICTKANRQGT